MDLRDVIRSLMLVLMASVPGARADETPTCRYRPAASIAEIDAHQTFSAAADGHAAVVGTPSLHGPWRGEIRVRISRPTSTVWRDGRSFAATSGPSAVTWMQADGTDLDACAVDRVNGDLHHWRNGRIAEGGRRTGTAFPF